MSNRIRETVLHNTNGTSDKIYQIQVEELGNNDYKVNKQWGRRGSTFQTKTQNFSSLKDANKEYDKTVNSKLSDGYFVTSIPAQQIPQSSNSSSTNTSTPNQTTPNQPPPTGAVRQNIREKSGINCQLANPVAEGVLENLFCSDEWALQPKFDGVRSLLGYENIKTISINRLGELVTPSEEISELSVEISNLLGDFLLDGELIGLHFYAFDILKVQGMDLRSTNFAQRAKLLQQLFSNVNLENLTVSPCAYTTEEKRRLFNLLKAENREGAIFRKLDSVYTESRPASGGTLLKFKFTDSATCIVTEKNPQRSVKISMLDANGNNVAVGNCSIPANADVPEIGDLIEVQYLYAFAGGSLYQPVYKGVREDLTAPDKVDTLKFKNTNQATAA